MGGRGGQVAHLVQDDTRVEHKGGVKEMLQLPHELISFAAPLHLHKGSHIAPCAVLTLQELHILWAQHQQMTLFAPIMSLRLCFEPPLQRKQGAELDGLMQQQAADSQCSSGQQNAIACA